MIPGIDGVGRLPDGQRVFFVAPDDRWGSMAERAVVDLRRSPRCPKARTSTKVAAAMNPGHVRLGGPAPPGPAPSRSSRSSSSGPPATPEGWPSKWRDALVPAGSLGPGEISQRLSELPASAPMTVVALADDPDGHCAAPG